MEPEDTSRNFHRELEGSIEEFHLPSGQVPPGHAYDGIVVTGSRTSVYWDEPWIAAAKAWLGEATDRGIPVLGVCWGHQLLADVLGGTVEAMGRYEIGYRTVEHTGTDRLFDGIGREFTVFTTHQDAVVELPPGARATASNDYSNHGFRSGPFFGVQFHPEYDMATAEYVARVKDIDEARRERVLADITPETYARACEAKQVFGNFTDFVCERAGTEPSSSGEAASD